MILHLCCALLGREGDLILVWWNFNNFFCWLEKSLKNSSILCPHATTSTHQKQKKNNFIDYSCGKFIHFQFIALCNHNCSHHFHIESWKLESITFLDAIHNYRTLLLQQLTDGSCRLVENLFVLLVLGIMRPYIDFSPRSLTLSMKTTCVLMCCCFS